MGSNLILTNRAQFNRDTSSAPHDNAQPAKLQVARQIGLANSAVEEFV